AALGIAVVLGLAACSADDANLDPQIASSQAAVESDICDNTDLDFTASATCAGPWVYKQYATETSRHNLCACEVRSDCSFWQTQVDYVPTTNVNFPGINCFFQDHTHQKLCDPDFTAAHNFCNNWAFGAGGPYHFIDDPVDQQVT